MRKLIAVLVALVVASVLGLSLLYFAAGQLSQIESTRPLSRQIIHWFTKVPHLPAGMNAPALKGRVIVRPTEAELIALWAGNDAGYVEFCGAVGEDSEWYKNYRCKEMANFFDFLKRLGEGVANKANEAGPVADPAPETPPVVAVPADPFIGKMDTILSNLNAASRSFGILSANQAGLYSPGDCDERYSEERGQTGIKMAVEFLWLAWSEGERLFRIRLRLNELSLQPAFNEWEVLRREPTVYFQIGSFTPLVVRHTLGPETDVVGFVADRWVYKDGGDWKRGLGRCRGSVYEQGEKMRMLLSRYRAG